VSGEQGRIKLVGIQETFQAQGPVLRGAQVVQLVVVEDQVLVGGIGVAADNGPGLAARNGERFPWSQAGDTDEPL